MIPMLVVPTLTRHDLLVRMLGSIDHPVGHLVIIDNSGRGFVGGSGPWERMTVLPMPTNLGVAASWNLAVRLAYKHPWVMVASDDMWWEPGVLSGFAEMASEETLVLAGNFPHWQAFTLGMGLVARVGLFDEGYYPAYFEDIEYLRRMGRNGVQPEYGPETKHDNSSTLKTVGTDFRDRNGRSWEANRSLFDSERPGGFDPYRWRALGWL
jgi:GT2 family glycosyltransferase